MVGPFMLCGNEWGLSGRHHGWPADGGNGWGLSGRCHGLPMDALRERMESEWTSMDALRERVECEWTLSWSAHGCSAGTDGV